MLPTEIKVVLTTLQKGFFQACLSILHYLQWISLQVIVPYPKGSYGRALEGPSRRYVMLPTEARSALSALEKPFGCPELVREISSHLWDRTEGSTSALEKSTNQGVDFATGEVCNATY